MFPSRYMPCPDCGASLERRDDAHECERERWLEFQLFQLRDDVDGFEAKLAEYLNSPWGKIRAVLLRGERAHRRG